MYEVNFNQIVKDQEEASCPNALYVSDLERALAIASLLQKISTPEVKYEAISIEPVKLGRAFVETQNFIDHENK